MTQELKNEHGKVTISRDVISVIAGLAAMECYGLVGMSSQRVQDGLAELLGRENLSKGVSVKFDENNKAIIDLFIIVEYGINIQEVAHNVMEKVHYTLRDMVGLEEVEVNVNVQGVRFNNGS